jgi:hypothetical protein
MAVDTRLHAERMDPGTRTPRRHAARYETLPDGAFVVVDGEAFLVLEDRLLRWTPLGYAEPLRRPAEGAADVITPPSLVAVLATAWTSELPLLHPSSGAPTAEPSYATDRA